MDRESKEREMTAGSFDFSVLGIKVTPEGTVTQPPPTPLPLPRSLAGGKEANGAGSDH